MEQEGGGYQGVETIRTIWVTVIRHSTDFVDQVNLGEDTLPIFHRLPPQEYGSPSLDVVPQSPIAACRSGEWAKQMGVQLLT